jgi:hypothetical protein
VNGDVRRRGGVGAARVHGVWLFAVTYLVHLLEEYAAGEGFVAWADRTLGVSMSLGAFVGWNAFAFGLLCVGARLVSRDPRLRWIEIAMAIAMLGNTAVHATASVLTWTYSPGLASAVLLWGPLGVIRGPAAWRASSRRGRRAGVLIGAAAVLITLVVMLSSVARACTAQHEHGAHQELRSRVGSTEPRRWRSPGGAAALTCLLCPRSAPFDPAQGSPERRRGARAGRLFTRRSPALVSGTMPFQPGWRNWQTHGT